MKPLLSIDLNEAAYDALSLKVIDAQTHVTIGHVLIRVHDDNIAVEIQDRSHEALGQTYVETNHLREEPEESEDERHVYQEISATVTSGDGVHKQAFNAIAWFEKASDHDIMVLAEESFCDGPAADQVALHFNRGGTVLYTLLTYCRISAVPFKVEINVDEVRRWRDAHRPHLVFECFDPLPKAA
jgi:hypothetical protein